MDFFFKLEYESFEEAIRETINWKLKSIGLYGFNHFVHSPFSSLSSFCILTSQFISLPPPVDDRAGTDAVRENEVHLYKVLSYRFL